MTLVVLTGARGFLGWHARVLARTLGWSEPVVAERADLHDPDRLAALVDGADRVVHLAGANRGTPDEVTAGNIEPARALAEALRRCARPPKAVALANSVQAGNGTAYGDAKAAAAGVLAEATRWSGTELLDLRLPNLFGEHGRPFYNSVVATFCRVLANGGEPRVDADRELELLHATDAVAALLGADPPDTSPAGATRRSVGRLAAELSAMAATYRTGDIPPLPDPFSVRLFNTYRSHCFSARAALPLTRRADQRGELVEAVRTHGGAGQTFYSTTRPGVTRGEHYHLAKVERFVVLRGEAEIRLRRLLHDEVVRLRVRGDEPVAVDMPAMWAHSVTNVGRDDLLTLFWANEVFDPDRPDTYPEAVG
jgi:UDP-2-acetamido-2,6-beta-L-arabino-hexul-4-ose reductase